MKNLKLGSTQIGTFKKEQLQIGSVTNKTY